MNFTTGMGKPSKFTAENYGTKISVEIDHSDLDLDEVMDAFQTLIIGMGYHENSFKNWVIDRADEYRETDAEDLKEKLEAWKNDEDEIELRHRYIKDSDGYEDLSKLEDEFFGSYRATQEDEAEFDEYGARIVTDSSFEWGDEPEDDNLFEGDEWEANENLKSANERYKKEVKKMTTKKRNNKN